MSTEYDAVSDTYYRPIAFDAMVGEYGDLPARGLTADDLKHWGYQLGASPLGKPCHIMNYRDEKGTPIAQKFRWANKEFTWQGETKDPPLYGIWLWGSKGKSVVITEGEIDAISVSKAFGHRWPVVSLPNGSASVAKVIKRCYAWLDGFDKILLWFDADQPGQKAVAEAVELLPPGKVWIIRSPEGAKDANDTLREHGTKGVSDAFWKATLWRPDGIVDGADLTREMIKKAMPAGIPWPYPKLNEMTYGLREGELTLLTAAPGIGKSTFARELAYYLVTAHGKRVGNIFLEEAVYKTAQGYVAIHNNVPLGRLRANPDLLTDDQWDRALAVAVSGRMWFYNHFGSLDSDSLISKIAYYRKVLGVNHVVLDHISIVTSGLESSREGERKDIDILMTKLRQVIEQTGVGVVGIVHLKREKGMNFNEGDQISLKDLRGSGSLEQLSDNVFALERDQQNKREDKRTQMQIRVLKCRESGDTGLADTIDYDRATGRLRLLHGGFTADPGGFTVLPDEDANLKAVLAKSMGLHTF